MTDSNESTMICDVCNANAVEGATSCAGCGSFYGEPQQCLKHGSVNGIGVCVLCGEAGCNECCAWAGSVFLCNDHAGYEIVEEHAVVFTSLSSLRGQYVLSVLQQAGLHPFDYASPYSPGTDLTAIGANSTYQRTRSVFKIFTPFNEVGEAQKVLDELGLDDA